MRWSSLLRRWRRSTPRSGGGPAALGLLARELDAALDTIQHVPRVGRRIRSARFRGVRRLLLRASGYHVYYQVDEVLRAIRIVHVLHARRQPMAER